MHRDLSPLSADPLDTANCRTPEITDIRCDMNTLLVTVKDMESGQETIVEFAEFEGFRVLDEGDLLEFWPTCSSFWLYKITAGGWLEQECLRPGFVARETKNVLEFFIAGVNACVSVIAWSEPKVTAKWL
mgnify:CR=1 FL=1|jgi:hypothetical protein